MRRGTASLLLLLSIGLSVAAAERLKTIRAIPPRPALFYGAFVAALALAASAGALARDVEGDDGGGAGDTVAPPAGAAGPQFRAARIALFAAAAVLSLATLLLQHRSPPPPVILATWLGGIVCLVAGLLPARREARRGRRGERLAIALAVALCALGGAARLSRLGTVPATFGGDEANQMNDGRQWISGEMRSDPFGIGWYKSVRLGMLSAGAGSLLAGDPVAGARRPYAAAGTLALVAAAAGAGALGGPWAAAACAALLAFAPHHVHFSRLASHMVLDSLFASVVVLGLFALRRTGHVIWAGVAGLAAGAALYGYSGGQLIPLVFLVGLPLALARTPNPAGRRAAVAAALGAFAVAGGPSLQIAFSDFAAWHGRFSEVIVFRPGYWESEVKLYGSPARLLVDRVHCGTLGLLGLRPTSPWYTGYPVIAPSLLPALGIAGLGWLLGRRRWEALIPALIVGGNLAGVALTDGPPSGQRASSLVPMLALLGGAAVGGLASLAPARGARLAPGRAAVAGLAIALAASLTLRELVAGERVDPYGGDTAAIATSFLRLDRDGTRYAGLPLTFHTRPEYDGDFPVFLFLLTGHRLRNEPPPEETGDTIVLDPGLHLFSSHERWARLRAASLAALGLRRGIAVSSPVDPARDLATLVPVARTTVVRVP